jgi:hypothetical protein
MLVYHEVWRPEDLRDRVVLCPAARQKPAQAEQQQAGLAKAEAP